MSKTDQRQKEKVRAQAKIDERRRVTLRVLEGCDEAGAKQLATLAATGVVATCAEGCSHCCRLKIPISRAEGEVVADWLLANRTPEQLAGIRERLGAWLGWYRTEYPQLLASGRSRSEAFAKHAPMCSLLENHRCTVYAVRPITCRNHLVSSPVANCEPASMQEPDPILAVSMATRTHVVELQNLISRQGGDYRATIHLIAEWLAHLLDVEREPWHKSPRLELG